MKHRGALHAKLKLIGCSLLSVTMLAQQPAPPDHYIDVSRWKTFANRAGWAIKHPSDWRVGSCKSCPDPTDPGVFVTLENPSSKGLILIEHLVDRPPDQSVEQWLDDVMKTTNLNPLVHEEWISLDGTRALKAVNRSPDTTESESIYVVHGSKTFAIRTDLHVPSYPLYQRMLSTFRFTSNP